MMRLASPLPPLAGRPRFFPRHCLLLLWLCLVSFVVVATMAAETASHAATSQETTMPTASSSSSSLQLARQLAVPSAFTELNGELEHLDFWESNQKLIQDAWQEWWGNEATVTSKDGSSAEWDVHPSTSAQEGGEGEAESSSLPRLLETHLVNETVHQQIHSLWDEPTIEKEQALLNASDAILEEAIPGVYVIPNFFTPHGIQSIRKHLRACQSSQIPTRRPNGMNRHGIIIDDDSPGGVWYPELEHFRTWLVDTYVRPLGRMLFPEYIGNDNDDSSAYAFTIQYSSQQDLQLKEHSDASVVTMNINLNDPYNENDMYEGSSLLFRNMDSDEKEQATLDKKSTGDLSKQRQQPQYQALDMQPGMAVIHRGLHRHQALPITGGQRTQLIIWLFGDHGYVRFAPYPPEEQLSVQQRWQKPGREVASSVVAAQSFVQDACWNLQAVSTF